MTVNYPRMCATWMSLLWKRTLMVVWWEWDRFSEKSTAYLFQGFYDSSLSMAICVYQLSFSLIKLLFYRKFCFFVMMPNKNCLLFSELLCLLQMLGQWHLISRSTLYKNLIRIGDMRMTLSGDTYHAVFAGKNGWVWKFKITMDVRLKKILLIIDDYSIGYRLGDFECFTEQILWGFR